MKLPEPADIFPLRVWSTLSGYGIAVGSVAITFVITLLLSPLVPPDISSLFLIAVMVSAWRGGLGAGLFATVLSALIDIFIFLPPTASLSFDNGDFLQLVVNTIAAVIVGTLSASQRKIQTERKRLLLLEQNARLEAEHANEIKSEFLAAVSHELRTPLTTIKTLTRLLLRNDSFGGDAREYLEDIALECDRQIDLVHNLLDLSRLKAGSVDLKLGPVDIHDVFEACETMERVAALQHNQQITFRIEPHLPPVSAELSALRRAVCSIVENAIKFTPANGRIELVAHAGKPGRLCIDIIDNGFGIDESDLPHIFDSFYCGKQNAAETQTKEKAGVGLGLHLARSLVEAMNGEITVTSKLDHGSTFTIELPVWNSSPAASGIKRKRHDEKVVARR